MIQIHPRPRVLLLGSTCGDPSLDAALRDIADVYTLPGAEYDDEALLIQQAVKRHGPFDIFGGLFVPGDKFPMKWDEGLLGSLAPRCKVYLGPGAGYDKVDVDWISSTGAYYCNSPIAVGRRTADGAIMLLLAAMRGLVSQVNMQYSHWNSAEQEGPLMPTRKLVGSKYVSKRLAGMYSLGNIGLQIANLAQSLGFKKIIYHTRTPNLSHPEYTHVSLEELYAESDAIVITCPLNDSTRGMINDKAFEGMKEDMILVNVARGPIVDDEALVRALDSGKVRRAALDVFTNEPEIHPGLINDYRVTLSPHCAAAPGPDFARIMNTEVVQNIMVYLTTGKPQSAVNLIPVQKVFDARA